MYKRLITKKINFYFENNFRIIILIGQRRIGKTVELKKQYNGSSLYFDLEDFDNKKLLSNPSVAHLKNVIGTKTKNILIDEIQYGENIGSILKLIHDYFPKIKVIASGSASFLIMQKIGDSALGRKVVLHMYPLTVREIIDQIDEPFEIGRFNKVVHEAQINELLNQLLIYGSLPEILSQENYELKRERLSEYVNSLLFKDVFEIENIKNPDKIRKLTKLLALQIGGLVKMNELAQQLELSRDTVIRYVDLLEKFKIIQTISAFSQNPRKELNKPVKIYFTDIGIRNAVVNDFRIITNRESQQLGGLFENLVFNTLQSNISYYGTEHKIHYWRDRNGYEIDFLLTKDNDTKLTPIEVKFNKNVDITESFVNLYKDNIDQYHCINKDNFWSYI
jgi:hypothetical protein